MTRIIMIDDEPLVRESVGRLLKFRGHDVVCFDSAESFLTSPIRDDADCLVVDYRLPGLNGCELLRQLRSQSVRTPALLFSGNIDETIDVMLDGVSGVIPLGKPCHSAALYDAVDRCLAANARTAL